MTDTLRRRLLQALGAAPLAASWPAAEAAEAATIPLEAFARPPLLTGASLSPNGRQLAALLHIEDGTALVTRALDVARQQFTPVIRATDELAIGWAGWANDERLLVGTRHLSQRGFVRVAETRLWSVRPDGSELKPLWQRGQRHAGHSAQFQDDVLDWLPDDARHVLLQLPAEAKFIEPGVYLVDVESGERRLVHGPERQVRRWITDAAHRVRVGLKADDGRYEVRACDPDGRRWRTLWSFDGLSADAVWPIGFDTDPQRLYVSAQHEGRSAVFAVDLNDDALPRRLVVHHPRLDLDGASALPAARGGGLLGLCVGEGAALEPPRGELWREPVRALMRQVDAALPRRYNRLLALSADEQTYLLHSSGNGRPGEYFVGERRSGELATVGRQFPLLAGARLAGKREVSIRSRDGLPLMAYLSLPPTRAEGQPGSLVLLPHGGPASRDDDDFDLWVEVLASRGHAVLQVNFRGSHGQGREFMLAGLRRWGLEMQDDLSDAVAWAVAQRIADARSVAIVGASYGGYAALMGAIKTPALYRCAVSFAGVTHLPDQIHFEGDYVDGYLAAEASIGRLWGDRAQLRETSPALQAERIQVPVLLVHGDADLVVPVSQGRTMAEALRRAGKRYEYIEQPGVGHQFGGQRSRTQFFGALERFLAEQLLAA